MAEYPKITLTNKAMEMIAAAQIDGNVLTITRVKIGDGSLADGADIKSMTDVINSMLIAPFSSSNNDGDGQITVHFAVSNSTVEAGFFAREIGVFAKLNDGEEQLYAYTNAGNRCDWIPDKHTPIDSQVIDLTLIVGNAENVTVMVTDDAFALARDFLAHEVADDAHKPAFNAHNADTSAHSNVFTKYLPLAGGTMTGAIITSSIVLGRKKDNTGEIGLLAGADVEHGAAFVGYGANYSNAEIAGMFRVRATDGSYIKDLCGKPDGELSWNGKNIVRSINGVNADVDGNVDLTTSNVVCLVESAVNDDGSWYRKYSDGWLEQGGVTARNNSHSYYTVNLLKPYADNNYYVGCTSISNNTGYANNTTSLTPRTAVGIMGAVFTKTTTYMTVPSIFDCVWYACGMGENK